MAFSLPDNAMPAIFRHHLLPQPQPQPQPQTLLPQSLVPPALPLLEML